jgi:hypothetical protein
VYPCYIQLNKSNWSRVLYHNFETGVDTLACRVDYNVSGTNPEYIRNGNV